MKVLVIVVTYNGAKWIDKCFGSLTSSSIPVNILAVDNGSTDDSIMLIKNRFPSVEVIETKENLGFGKANNIGLKRAVAENVDYVFLLNQDAWIETDTISKCISAAVENSKYGVLSPMHFNWDGNKVDGYFLEMVNPDNCKDFLSDLILSKSKTTYKVHFIHAACWLITSDCLKKVGGFDPLFPHYGEDNDYIERATFYKFDTAIVSSTIVYHGGFSHIVRSEKFEIYMALIRAKLQLKTIQNSLIVNYILFFKHRFDEITTFLILLKFKKALNTFKLLVKATLSLGLVKKSRKISKSRLAFLDINHFKKERL